MKFKYFHILLAIFLYFKGSSQFIVWPQETSLGGIFQNILPQTNVNYFNVLKLVDFNQTSSYREPHQILTFNLNGQLLDSTILPRGFNPVSIPYKYGNNYYWAAVYYDTLSTSINSQRAYILKLDSFFNTIDVKTLNISPSTIELPSNVIKINNSFFVSVKNQINNELKLYKLDTQLNKRDSITFSGNQNIIELKETYDRKILISGYGFPPISVSGSQKIVVDTLFNIVNIYNLDSLTYVIAGGSVVTGCSSQISIDALYFKILPISHTKNYLIGQYDVVYNANCDSKKNLIHSVIDHSNQIINSKIIGDSTRDVRYADNINYACYNNGSIYTVAAESYTGQILQNNNTNILVIKSDTLGNLIWTKKYGDNMFYRPVSIIQTLDSSLLISGIRYDYQNTTFLNIAQGFILKLDKDGNPIMTGVKQYSSETFNEINCYPNPAYNTLFIDVPFEKEYTLLIYNLLGEIVFSKENYKNQTEIDIHHLLSGAYVLKVKVKNRWLTHKLIKH
ncbi:MAG: T9SS type A sorting domain-containing protein [Bacteroidia bacterium]|nr:T9SS type A sorting domain-containing protein [Bacteroidia bacterium]